MAGSVLVPAAVASAAVTVPFQINPAPFGNPNGSLDAPPVRCMTVVGEQSGTIMITSPKEGQWGCRLLGEVRWLNLSSGASGSTRISDGANGHPAATLPTGAGHIVVAVIPTSGPITPGFATVYVP
ncbi:hypothetical protein ERC79_12160 [Rhodococcus sp. ABRD24]|nr:hypothetical protein ERC79_12160 [Rhodococcus sp. ABRD24]